VRGDEPILAKTAILWCVRNEDTGRVIRNIEPMMEGIRGLRAQPVKFRFFILSDTQLAGGSPRTEGGRAFAALAKKWEGPRRDHLPAGAPTIPASRPATLFDFCTRWGRGL